MNTLIYESICVGLITLVLSKIIIKIVIEFKRFDDDNKQIETPFKNTYLFNFIFFLTGVLIHLVLEYIGLNKWYCNKDICVRTKSEL